MFKSHFDPINIDPLKRAKFSLGDIVATPAALSVLEKHQCSPIDLLHRHMQCDWGCVCSEDAKLNNEGVAHGGRLLSSYEIASDVKIWVITEWDRAVTTLLLPSDY